MAENRFFIGEDLEVACQRMAQDETREAEALEWAEATVGDAAGEAHATRRFGQAGMRGWEFAPRSAPHPRSPH